MKKKVIIWGVIIAAVAGTIALASINKDKGQYISVKTSEVTKGDIKSYLSTTGAIKSKNSKNYFPLQGKVKKVNVKVGDIVSLGQTLVEYEVQDLNSAVKQAQIQYDNAVLSRKMLNNNNNTIKSKISDINEQIANIDKQIQKSKNSVSSVSSSSTKEQMKLLTQIRDVLNSFYSSPSQGADLKTTIDEINKQIANMASGVSSSSTASQVQSLITTLQTQKAQMQSAKESLTPVSTEQFKQADNAIALAKVALDTAKQNLSKNESSIISGIDGVVTAVNVVEGAATMSASQPAVTVQNIEDLKAVVEVGKYDADKIKLGQEAVIKSGDKEYKGKVSFIDPAATKSVSAIGSETTLGVEVDILEKAENLKIDFDTDVDILLGEISDVLKIPAESIVTNKEAKTFVYVVENGKAVEKEVKLGLQSDMEAQVLDGLNDKDKVILNPISTLKDGDLVKEANGEDK